MTPLLIGTCPVDINSAQARLVAADWFEDQGRIDEANLLKQIYKELFYTDKVEEKVRSFISKKFLNLGLGFNGKSKKIQISKSFMFDGRSMYYGIFLEVKKSPKYYESNNFDIGRRQNHLRSS